MAEQWKPYRPPWYPERDPNHNPWATDPATYQQGHEPFYATWSKSLAPGELDRLIAESRDPSSASTRRDGDGSAAAASTPAGHRCTDTHPPPSPAS